MVQTVCESGALSKIGVKMSEFLVVGAGAIGTLVARQLADKGHAVRLVSRSGTDPKVPGVTAVAADAGDSTVLSRLAENTSAIFNCVNPPYHRWASDWPPVANALLAAAESSGAVLVTLSNLYPYGVVTAPMTPSTPMLANYEKAQVRAKMWNDALAAHESGRIRATEVRASDFIGPRSQSLLGERVIPNVLKGKACTVLGAADQPHSWTYINDVAATLIRCAERPDAWGRVWHVPTNPPRTQHQAIDDVADAAGLPHVKVKVLPSAMLRLLGLFSPLMRELPKTEYQFTAPFVIDDSATRSELGLEPTPWATVLKDTIAAYNTGAS